MRTIVIVVGVFALATLFVMTANSMTSTIS